jgi:class 3 adenylate cyclase
MSAEILDMRFRTIFFSSQAARVLGLSAEEARGMYGRGLIHRTLEGEADIMRLTEESGTVWFQQNAPIMRHYLDSDDPDFDEVFSLPASLAAQIDPIAEPPRAWHDVISFRPDVRIRENVLGDVYNVHLRISDDAGSFIGVLVLHRSALPQNLEQRLARGDQRLFERMERVSEPGKRAAGILFADLEASGALSRRLSSRGYFDLIRAITDRIDRSVVALDGIVGKHAGDGGSALFLVSDHGSESAAARATIEAARAIRDGAASLEPEEVEAKLNVGVHWGGTLMIGQIATSGRLEVTALGDQMNEGARIEAAATEGAILASKDLIERLTTDDAEATGLDPDAIAYTPLAELPGLSEKAIRDAGSIAVARI